MLGLLLLLVTMRGLRGTPQAGSGYFYALVAVCALALAAFMSRARPWPAAST